MIEIVYQLNVSVKKIFMINKIKIDSWFKGYKKIIVGIILIIFLANVFPLGGVFRLFLDEKHYRYSNYNGSLTFTVISHRNFEMLKNRHRSCLAARPNLKDKNIYRLFTKNPLTFWRWGRYFFDESYKLPYKNWEEIKKNRETEKIKAITGCPIEF